MRQHLKASMVVIKVNKVLNEKLMNDGGLFIVMAVVKMLDENVG